VALMVLQRSLSLRNSILDRSVGHSLPLNLSRSREMLRSSAATAEYRIMAQHFSNRRHSTRARECIQAESLDEFIHGGR
jgi:hypothetical protein